MIRWGILGCGKIANKFASDLIQVEDARLVAVGSRSIEKSRNFAEQYHAEHAFSDYETLCAHPDLDIIYIATPHSFHHEHCKLALNAGKNVLCEKPLTVNATQTLELIELAHAKNCFLMEALWTRFLPVMKDVLQLHQNLELGPLHNIYADFAFYTPVKPNSRLFHPSLAGGSLLDIGIYPVFLAYCLLGNPQEIQAIGRIRNGVDLNCSMLLSYSNDVTANLHCSLLYHSDMKAILVYDKGNIVIQPRWHESDSYIINRHGQPSETIMRPKAGRGFTHEIQACHDALNNGALEHSDWSHQNTLSVMKILDRIRKQIGLQYPFETV